MYSDCSGERLVINAVGRDGRTKHCIYKTFESVLSLSCRSAVALFGHKKKKLRLVAVFSFSNFLIVVELKSKLITTRIGRVG